MSGEDVKARAGTADAEAAAHDAEPTATYPASRRLIAADDVARWALGLPPGVPTRRGPVATSSGIPDPADALPEGKSTLSRAEVLRHRQAWQRGEGHPWKLALVSESTYMRARHRYHLVPWPREYQDKLTP